MTGSWIEVRGLKSLPGPAWWSTPGLDR